MAIEDTEEGTVEVYNWVHVVDENGETVLERQYEEMSSEHFSQFRRNDYTFIGYTIPSKCGNSYNV